ncbi:hypothetical protein Tco_0648679 [Tanacetum coccineum]
MSPQLLMKRFSQHSVIPQTTAISNIKLPILKKDEYDIWAMEMEHYLEYIDNDVWKVIQNGNSKKRISTGKDGVIRILPPVSPAEIHAVEKERKARTILLMAIPKEHLRRFHGMDDAKEIWEAIRTRFGGNANSKKMQKAVLKQQFKRDPFYQDQGAGKKEQKQNCLLIMDDGVVNWGEHTVEEEESNHALMAISSSSELSESFLRVPQEVYGVKPITTNEKGVSAPKSKEVEPSCVTHIKTPRQPIKDQETHEVKGKNWNEMMERELSQMSHSHAVKENWGSAVKTSAGYNWRNSKPHSNCDSGPIFFRTVNAKGPQGRPKPVTMINWRILKNSMGDLLPLEVAKATYLVTPKTSHLNAVKRIFKYLKGKPNLGLWKIHNRLSYQFLGQRLSHGMQETLPLVATSQLK